MAKSFEAKQDVYLEIAQRYERYITLGVIKRGEKLPSVREAASELRVNPGTVQKAFSLLEEKGIIRSIPKKGAFVIFGEEKTGKNSDLEKLILELLRLKECGVGKDMIISAIQEVYENDQDKYYNSFHWQKNSAAGY